MALLSSTKGMEIVKKHITLKKVKTGFGHDLCGAFAEFYLDGKKMGYFNDDGWGGETDIVFDSDTHQKTFETFLTKNNVAQIMFENGWEFLRTVSKINLHDQAEEIINSAINLKEEEKAENKVQKACEKGIYYKSGSSYKGITFKIPLKAILLRKEGLEFIQGQYDKMKASLKNGEYIVNKNLEELGIRI
jgi:hypothetical protein